MSESRTAKTSRWPASCRRRRRNCSNERAPRTACREIEIAFVERVAAVYRNTVLVCAAYRPAVWNGPLLVLRALRRDHAGDLPPDWSAFARGPARFIDMDCTHTDLMSTSQAASIAPLIEPLLERENHGTS
jgi:thioesterase domain-containing protein